MGPKKGRRMRKIEVSTDTQFEFRDTAADIQRREEQGTERVVGSTETTEGGQEEGGSQEGGNHTLGRGGSA